MGLTEKINMFILFILGVTEFVRERKKYKGRWEKSK